MQGLADGIRNNIDKVQRAAASVSNAISGTMDGPVQNIVNNATTGYGGTIVIEGSKVMLYDKVIGEAATRYITSKQINSMAAKGGRIRNV